MSADGLTIAIEDYIQDQVGHVRELWERALAARDHATSLQAAEYARRLDDLNHNLRMMLDDRKQFYNRDQHDEYAKEIRRVLDDIDSKIHTIGNRVTAAESRSTTWVTAIGVTFALLNIVLHFWK